MLTNLTSFAILLHNRFSLAFKSALFTLIILCTSIITSLGATITSFSPASGSAGTLVTVKGIGFTSVSILTIGGVRTIVTSATTTQIVGIVMPGAITGKVTVNTSTNAATDFTVTETPYPTVQQGRKIADTDPASDPYLDRYPYGYKRKAVALSADGNTAIVSVRHGVSGGAIIYTRQNARWQQASPIVNLGVEGVVTSVGISADGSTAAMGGATIGPVPVMILRSVNGSWSRPLVERLENSAEQQSYYGPYVAGNTVSITADGNTILVGAGIFETAYTRREPHVGDYIRIFNHNSTGWAEVPSPRTPGYQYFGISKATIAAYPGLVSSPGIGGAISADGKTAALIAQRGLRFSAASGHAGYSSIPYTIIYSRASRNTNNWVAQQMLEQFSRVQLSADGNTLLATRDAGDYSGSYPGATQIYTRNGSTWSLAQTLNENGEAVLSADGSTLLIAGNATVYTRVGGSYVKKSELKPGYYATSAALSADGTTAFVGTPFDNGSLEANNFTGAVYAFGTSLTPGVATTNIVYTGVYSPTGTTIGINWTNGGGAGRAVFVKQTTAVDEPAPEDRYYKPKTQFKTGDQVGSSGWYCVYNGTGSNVAIQGLVFNTTYRIAVMEYSGTESKPNYLPVAPLLGIAAPQIGPPTTQASNLVFSNRRTTSGTLTWTNGNGTKRAVFLKSAPYSSSYLAEQPTPTEVLEAGTSVEPFTDLGAWECVYNGTGSTVNFTGLRAGGIYTAAVLEYNGDSDDPKFLFPAANKLVGTADAYRPATRTYCTEITATTATAWWDGAGAGGSVDPYGSAVFIKFTDGTDTDDPIPANVYYQASTRFGVGSQIGNSGWYCVYNGPSAYSEDMSVKITGLTTGRSYRVAVVGYIGAANAPQYLPGTVSRNLNTLLVEPTGYATGLAFSNTAPTSTTLSWVNSNGTGRAVFLKLGTSGALNVQQEHSYAANSTFGAGDMAGTNGWYCVYNGTGNSVNITGLNPTSTYRAIVLEYNSYSYAGEIYNPMYNLTRYNGANVTTTVAPAMFLTTNQKRLLMEQDVLAESTTPELNIHQGMSPNGDGANDVFTIDGIGAYPQNTVKILNSNGDVIYSATGYDNYLKAFDGHSAKGDLQKAGTYFYSVEYKKGTELVRTTGYLIIKY
jgi:gliding motility-associated-like protein